MLWITALWHASLCHWHCASQCCGICITVPAVCPLAVCGLAVSQGAACNWPPDAQAPLMVQPAQSVLQVAGSLYMDRKLIKEL